MLRRLVASCASAEGTRCCVVGSSLCGAFQCNFSAKQVRQDVGRWFESGRCVGPFVFYWQTVLLPLQLRHISSRLALVGPITTVYLIRGEFNTTAVHHSSDEALSEIAKMAATDVSHVMLL